MPSGCTTSRCAIIDSSILHAESLPCCLDRSSASSDVTASSFMPSIISGGVQEPCKQDSEDPFRMGLVLEWVYGTIVSTAEKARDSAKKSLGETCSFD